MPTRRLSQVALDALSPAEARALTWAQEILSHAMEYPRAGDGWPHCSAEEGQADAILRAAGLGHLLPDELMREREMDAAVHHFRAVQIWEVRQAECARLDAKRAARDTAIRAEALERAGARITRQAQRYPIRVTGTITYLGSGCYGLRCDRNVRASREIVLSGLGSADKGRTVTVRVEQFTETIENLAS